jgi:hypothetical protein
MHIRFARSAWERALRKFRLRPGFPIRRRASIKQHLLELVRLDDRIAPGSVWATAAAQAVALNGPFAWIGLDEPAVSAVGPVESIPSPSDTTGEVPAAYGASDTPTFSFAQASPAESAAGTSSQSFFVETSSVAAWDDASPDWPVSESSASAPKDMAFGAIAVAPHGDAGGFSQSASVVHTGGVAASGGLPPQPIADGGVPKQSSPQSAGHAAAPSAVSPSGKLAESATQPPAVQPHVPSGHFAAQLQALMHTDGSSSGRFDLGSVADQQGQIGALVGGQLSHASLLGGSSASAVAHRPASLLGQAINGGMGSNLGLRTSPSSSGPFSLVGTHSVGDLLAGPRPNGDNPLTGGAVAISGAVSSVDGPIGLSHALGLPGAVLSGQFGIRSNSESGGGGSGGDPTSYTADFTLSVTGDGSQPESVAESGTDTIAGMTPDQVDNGTTQLPADLNASVTVSDGQSAQAYNLNWVGETTPADLLYGADLNAFNAQAFDVDDATVDSYVYDTSGTIPFTSTDTSTPTDHNGAVTTAHHNNYATSGTDHFTIHIVGTEAGRQVTRIDTITSTVAGSDHGTDTLAAPSSDSDSFIDTNTDTHNEVDRTSGTLAADGTFTLTSFSIDVTDDTDYSDSVSGSKSQPEPGGSESDSFSESDSGHDHEHLHAEGTPESWTASLDDTDTAQFNDDDTGSESSSQTANGETDTNSDTFGAHDGGTFGDEFHFAGSGDANSFTATSVSDTIHDGYLYHDSDNGTSGDSSSGETDGDGYTATDDGDADERLTVTGGADSLTATYTDTVHDGFTDSDALTANWSSADGQGDSDTGHDVSTDGDGGNETLHIEADASINGWQSNSQGDPSWQMSHVDADVTGSAEVHSGDDGVDAQVAGTDSESDHFVDGSTGTDQFGGHISGDGMTFTLSIAPIFTLTDHSEDDTNDGWTDPTELDGEDATDHGWNEIDNIEDDTSTVGVTEVSTIDTSGNVTPTNTKVDVTSGGTDHLTDDGTDDDSAPNADDRETADDSAQLGEGVTIQAETAGGSTAVRVDQNLGGTVNLGGTLIDIDTIDPNDTDTDNGGGTLTGTVGGDLHETGSYGGNQFAPGPVSGDLDLDLDGSGNNTNTESGRVSGLDLWSRVTDFPIQQVTPPPVNFDTSPSGSATYTVTRTTNVPTFHLGEDDADAGGAWTLGDLDFTDKVITGTTCVGQYMNCLLLAGGSGTGTASFTHTDETSENGSSADLHGSHTSTDQWKVRAYANVNYPNYYYGDALDNLDKTVTDKVEGNETPAGPNLTETVTGTGSSELLYDITLDDSENHWWYYDLRQVYGLTESNSDVGGIVTPQAYSGTDESYRTVDKSDPTGRTRYTDDRYLDKSLQNGQPTASENRDWEWYTIWDTNGNVTYDGPNPPVPPDPNRDWFARAADFAAGMGDAVSCGITQRIRQAAGFDDVVDKNSGYYRGGQWAGTAVSIVTAGANPCGAARGMALAVRGLSAVQGAGQLANAADAAASGDLVGMGLNIFGARMSFSRMGAA